MADATLTAEQLHDMSSPELIKLAEKYDIADYKSRSREYVEEQVLRLSNPLAAVAAGLTSQEANRVQEVLDYMNMAWKAGDKVSRIDETNPRVQLAVEKHLETIPDDVKGKFCWGGSVRALVG